MVFMGGSGGHLTALIDWAMGHLHPGGRLVMRPLSCRKTFIVRWRILRLSSAHVKSNGLRTASAFIVNAAGGGTLFQTEQLALLSPVRRKKTMSETFDPRCMVRRRRAGRSRADHA